jgi:tripartite-type tricarboxylate transporter receptor subunit TctC
VIPRRALLGAAPAFAAGAAAQDWPARPVRMVVPYAPGGTSDVTMRALVPFLSARLGQPLVVENRPGANGGIGMEAVARAEPDGQTFIFAADSAVFQPLVRPALPYDTLRDLLPVAPVVSQPVVVAVHPSLGVQTLAEFVALARRRREEIPYALAGVGGTQQLAAGAFAERVGIRLMPVSYRGGGQAINDLLAGQVTLGFLGPTPVLPHLRQGRLRVLAVTAPRRSPALAEVPTVAEALSLPDYGIEQWFGVFAPRRLDVGIARRMNGLIAEALRQPEVLRLLADLALEPMVAEPEAFRAKIEAEGRVWADLGTRLGLGVD